MEMQTHDEIDPTGYGAAFRAIRTRENKMSYCDSCVDAATEDGAGGIEEEALALMGEDMADHLCDEIETDGEIRCACPCKRAAKRKLRVS